MKIIKKFNAFFVGVLFVVGIFATTVFLRSAWENADFDHLLVTGKAHSSIKTQETTKENENDGETGNVFILDSAKEDEVMINDPQDSAKESEKPKQRASKFTFVAIGDSESYNESTGYNGELISVLEKARSHRSDFAIFTGDIISTGDPSFAGNKKRITNVKNVIEKYFNHYYVVFGKHDIECGDKCVDAWKKTLFDIDVALKEERKLYHSFDYQNTHFVLLSADYPQKHSIDLEQLAWFEQDLKNNTQPNTIVVQHVPPVNFFKESAKQCHDMSCSPQIQKKLMNLFRMHGVDLVISGHENAFDHKIVDKVDFVLSGNSGNKARYKNVIKGDIYSHFSIDGEKIVLKAFKTDGTLVREIKIK